MFKYRKNINFDKNALVMPTKHVIKVLRHIYNKGYSNPSSTYLDGQRAAEIVNTARLKVAESLGCNSDEIFFTSGSSESIAWVAKNYMILADKRSHHAVIEAEKQSKDNEDLVYSFPWVVSETGECLKGEYEDTLKNKNIMIFADLTQAIGKEKIDLSKYPAIKFACASGQKIGGISGAGILYIKRKYQKKFKPLIFGSQENGYRGGTTNLPAIVCFGEAIEEKTKGLNKLSYMHKIGKIKNAIDNGIKKNKLDIEYKMSGNVVNITFKYLNATTAVQIFSKYGINISAGSACMSGKEKPSMAYIKAGYTKNEAMKTIRISVDSNNTINEVKKFIKVLKKIVALYDNND